MEKGQGKLIEIPWERNKVYFHPSWDLESDYAAEEQTSTDLAMIKYKIRNTDDMFPKMARPPFEYYLSCEIIQILKIISQICIKIRDRPTRWFGLVRPNHSYKHWVQSILAKDFQTSNSLASLFGGISP